MYFIKIQRNCSNLNSVKKSIIWKKVELHSVGFTSTIMWEIDFNLGYSALAPDSFIFSSVNDFLLIFFSTGFETVCDVEPVEFVFGVIANHLIYVRATYGENLSPTLYFHSVNSMHLSRPIRMSSLTRCGVCKN